jgi:hypothetical protein
MIRAGKSEDPVKKHSLPRRGLFPFASAFPAPIRKSYPHGFVVALGQLPMSKHAIYQRDGIPHDAQLAGGSLYVDTAGDAPGTATRRYIDLRCRHDGQSSVAFSD